MQITVKQRTADRLAALAHINVITGGQAIDALVEFAHSGSLIQDEAFQTRFNGLFETAVLNAGDGAGGWGAGAPGVHIEPGTGKANLNELQERIRQYEAGEID
jgi:hypothetical protein